MKKYRGAGGRLALSCKIFCKQHWVPLIIGIVIILTGIALGIAMAVLSPSSHFNTDIIGQIKLYNYNYFGEFFYHSVLILCGFAFVGAGMFHKVVSRGSFIVVGYVGYRFGLVMAVQPILCGIQGFFNMLIYTVYFLSALILLLICICGLYKKQTCKFSVCKNTVKSYVIKVAVAYGICLIFAFLTFILIPAILALIIL